MAAYAHYEGELSRNRFVAILLLPIIILSLLPMLLAIGLQSASYAWAFASSLNALFACVDVFGAAMVLCQVPRGATLRNQGWRTYWKQAGNPGLSNEDAPGEPP